MATPPETERPEPAYLPALRWKALTPLFDTAVRTTTRERTAKLRLLDQADVAPGDAVLDLGAGTGTLAIWLKQRTPGARVVGIDADAEILDRAGGKAAAAGLQIELVKGFSTELPFPDDRFDVVLSSLFFHHLNSEDKLETLREVQRVLVPGGSLHVADWGKPSDPVMAALVLNVRVFDGFDVTRDNVAGALPSFFEAAGLEEADERGRLRTALGSVSFYSARKPGATSSRRAS